MSSQTLTGFAVLPAAREDDRALTTPNPANYGEARHGHVSTRWKVAEREELASLEANETWIVIRRPKHSSVNPTV